MELLVLWAIFGVVGAWIGERRGGRGGMGCLAGILLGPIGWLIMAVTGPDKLPCPHCRERIHEAATVCPKCQREVVRN